MTDEKALEISNLINTKQTITNYLIHIKYKDVYLTLNYRYKNMFSVDPCFIDYTSFLSEQEFKDLIIEKFEEKINQITEELEKY